MEYKIVWQDGSSAKYSSLKKFLDAIHDEAIEAEDSGEFIVAIGIDNK